MITFAAYSKLEHAPKVRKMREVTMKKLTVSMEMDYKRLSCLMDAIIRKAQEVKSESEKEHPEVWKVCDLAIEDLNRLFDEVGACVFSRCINSVKTDLLPATVQV